MWSLINEKRNHLLLHKRLLGNRARCHRASCKERNSIVMVANIYKIDLTYFPSRQMNVREEYAIDVLTDLLARRLSSSLSGLLFRRK